MAAENRDVESFALGLIVAVLVYLLLDKKFKRLHGAGTGGSPVSQQSKSGGCGCGGDTTSASYPVIPIGGQSYSGYGSGPGPSPGGAAPAPYAIPFTFQTEANG
jgi:hypothetical protein